MFKKSGPQKVEAAFSLFTKAVSQLEDAESTCKAEAKAYSEQIKVLIDLEETAMLEANRARLAIENINTLIGA